MGRDLFFIRRSDATLSFNYRSMTSTVNQFVAIQAAQQWGSVHPPWLEHILYIESNVVNPCKPNNEASPKSPFFNGSSINMYKPSRQVWYIALAESHTASRTSEPHPGLHCLHSPQSRGARLLPGLSSIHFLGRLVNEILQLQGLDKVCVPARKKNTENRGAEVGLPSHNKAVGLWTPLTSIDHSYIMLYLPRKAMYSYVREQDRGTTSYLDV